MNGRNIKYNKHVLWKYLEIYSELEYSARVLHHK